MQKLTKEEAQELIDMLKHYVDKKNLDFPSPGKRVQFTVIGDTKNDKFAVNVYRQNKNPKGCTFQGRTEAENIVLMRLDVNPTAIHINPDGEKIKGTHLHIYSEEFDERYAVPFDIKDKDLFDICFTFFEKFNIIDGSDIFHLQYSMN